MLKPRFISTEAGAAGSALLLLALLLAGCAGLRLRTSPQQTTLRVMSFNLRFDNPADGEHAWPQRREVVASLMRFHDADLIGVQEALHHQLQDLASLLPDHAWLGVGRDDGRTAGEYSAILYRKQRFQVLQQATFWLSPEPEQAGSRGWDAACPRVVTWAQFRDLRSGRTFMLCNTHFDHLGVQARQESAKMLLRRLAEFDAGRPVIVTGDFNAEPDSPVYALLTNGFPDSTSALRDARVLAQLPPHGPVGTFHGFGQLQNMPRIDYIFLKNAGRVLRHGVLAEQWPGRYPSDHLPVLAEILLE